MNSFSQESTTENLTTRSTPHWSLDPAYETVKSRVSYVPGIKVIRGKTQVIVPEHKSHCPAGSVFKFNHGDIQAYDRRSSDGGKTWHYLSTIVFDTSKDVRGEGFDETSLVVMPENKVLSFIRSGASYQASLGSFNNNDPTVDMSFGYGKQTPVYRLTQPSR